ncbi:hypothetical protein BDV96DRAFT_583012 [Lophiotrema nucula]|uniref:Uncharacterized protein n=1 Tax=Lophiotrema nucula TaxID=690887 RepID=A0A6A5YW90_9PLEO|nr:hypothetical protein BDV96DRAFT_583012 [Lophiotrema nucula]
MSVAEAPKSTTPGTADAPVLSEKTAQDTDEQAGLLEKGKRKLFGLGKKKEEGDPKNSGKTNNAASQKAIPVSSLAPSPPLSPPTEHRLSPRSSPRMYPVGVASSPNRRINRSSSPALHSPASSQIFERNVQESVGGELSPEHPIPSHIQVLEDHIPPVLEASSLAITDNHLNPDEVEIIMHSAHQPASAAVAGGGTESLYSLSHDNLSGRKLPVGQHDADDGASNYGSLDTTDVRRLSFISFADVVQSEHVEPGRDPLEFMSLSSTANRSPSPVRSPASSHGFSVSPPSGATSEKGADLVSPKGTRSPGSPTTAASGELQIETMRQALRGAGNDLPGTSSQPLSAVSLEDSATDQPPFK